MPSLVIVVVAAAGLALASLAAFMLYVHLRYSRIIGRIFEETPVFMPLRAEPLPGGEEVRFPAADGLELAGTYYKARTAGRVGVIVFCHEYLGDRWSCTPYADGLRDLGFDLFTFDFRNHGDSGVDPHYSPLQWVSDLEVSDLEAALAYLRTRPDRDPAGVGLFGISRGGGAALVAAAHEPTVWGLVTDGAFPTRGTMLTYILRWAEIYVGTHYIWKLMPTWMFAFAGWAGRMTSQRKLGRLYPDLERAASRLAPRPWLMIHGARDAYILPAIAESLFAHAREPKELWLVPEAKHNRCREVAGPAYAGRLAAFFRRYAPRRLDAAMERSEPPSALDPTSAAVALAARISG